MYSLELSAPAKQYYEDLKTQRLDKLGEKVKKEVLHKEEKKFENLKLFPYMGITASKISDLLEDYYILIDKYEYIIYQVNEVDKIISVEYVMSTKEDIVQKIKKYFN